MNQEQLAQEIARLTLENERLKSAAKAKGTGLKVSDKGAVSLYGMGRFPITLYKEQWVKVLAKAEEINAFIQANDHLLTTKE